MKAQSPHWYQVFLRAIGANWLVCFAVWLSISARDTVSKIVAIWWPTATFVALGLDHVVANMFFVPMYIPTLLLLSACNTSSNHQVVESGAAHLSE